MPQGTSTHVSQNFEFSQAPQSFNTMVNGSATSESVAYGNWYFDYGAAHDFTPDFNMMEVAALSLGGTK